MKPSGTGSHILASNFIKVDNTYVRIKLQSHTGNTLDNFFTHAIQETEKQKIHALDFLQDKKTDVLECSDFHAMQSQHEGCFKRNFLDHFAKNFQIITLPVDTTRIQHLEQTDMVKSIHEGAKLKTKQN